MSHASYSSTNATMVGRTTAAFAEALEDAGIDDRWMERTVRELINHVACELIVYEENQKRPMSLHDAAHFLCSEANQ